MFAALSFESPWAKAIALLGAIYIVVLFVTIQSAPDFYSSPTTAINDGHPTFPNNGRKQSSVEMQAVVVAYAVSIIKCGDFLSNPNGLIDAAIVLRHSVHMNSVMNPASNSRYGYKMYAIVHRQAEHCTSALEEVGFELLIRDPPVNSSDIRGEYLRNNIHKELCCGSDEFVKLFAYTIPGHPIVVHTDLDFMMVQPMDELFDSMLFDSMSEIGKEARQRIEVEKPDVAMPKNIKAFLTRDYHQIIPGRIAAHQAGFIVLKPDQTVLDEFIELILEGNYVAGFGRDNGWGGKGYGGVVGAMTMQGVVAYFYDHIRPGTSVELNGCRYNFMGADILYRNNPGFHPKLHPELVGKCRNGRVSCEDCTQTDPALVKSIHYTNCKKPWNCVGHLRETGQTKDEMGIDVTNADFRTCMKVNRKWHEYRRDFEEKLYIATKHKNSLPQPKLNATDMKGLFLGHCNGYGQKNYISIFSSTSNLSIANKIYEDAHQGTTSV